MNPSTRLLTTIILCTAVTSTIADDATDVALSKQVDELLSLIHI